MATPARGLPAPERRNRRPCGKGQRLKISLAGHEHYSDGFDPAQMFTPDIDDRHFDGLISDGCASAIEATDIALQWLRDSVGRVAIRRTA